MKTEYPFSLDRMTPFQEEGVRHILKTEPAAPPWSAFRFHAPEFGYTALVVIVMCQPPSMLINLCICFFSLATFIGLITAVPAALRNFGVPSEIMTAMTYGSPRKPVRLLLWVYAHHYHPALLGTRWAIRGATVVRMLFYGLFGHVELFVAEAVIFYCQRTVRDALRDGALDTAERQGRKNLVGAGTPTTLKLRISSLMPSLAMANEMTRSMISAEVGSRVSITLNDKKVEVQMYDCVSELASTSDEMIYISAADATALGIDLNNLTKETEIPAQVEVQA